MSDETIALRQRIRAVIHDGPPLQLAVRFGSAAANRLHPDSDLDIGIIPADADLPLSAELTLQAKLETACSRDVDLVRLDRASTLVKWEAARSGIAIVADGPHTFSRFVAEAALEHADLMPMLAPAAERFRQRLASAAQSPAPHGVQSTE